MKAIRVMIPVFMLSVLGLAWYNTVSTVSTEASTYDRYIAEGNAAFEKTHFQAPETTLFPENLPGYQVISTPGHTKGHVAVLYGDCLFADAHLGLDFELFRVMALDP